MTLAALWNAALVTAPAWTVAKVARRLCRR